MELKSGQPYTVIKFKKNLMLTCHKIAAEYTITVVNQNKNKT